MRLYDALLGHTNELAEVASQVGGAAGEALMDECAAKVWQPLLEPVAPAWPEMHAFP